MADESGERAERRRASAPRDVKGAGSCGEQLEWRSVTALTVSRIKESARRVEYLRVERRTRFDVWSPGDGGGDLWHGRGLWCEWWVTTPGERREG
jgi:hypothetical protein